LGSQIQVPDSVASLPHAGAFTLPFSGRAELFQLLGLGDIGHARALCAARDLAPVAFDEAHALYQLSVMRWKQSPVGPYCSCFFGAVVEQGQPGSVRRKRPFAPVARHVLSAFLAAPKALFVPVYAVADAPGGPAGTGERSRAFGREMLGIEKTEARFNLTAERGLTHLQVLEACAGAGGRAVLSGFSLTLSVGRDGAVATAISPRLLLSRQLYWESAKAIWQRGIPGTFFMPSAQDGGVETIPIGTHFETRPRLLDLASDPRARFTPLVLDRPLSPRCLGALLEAADFSPRVFLWDPDLAGSITGRLDRTAAGVA
jgi:hypothetical protein